MDAALIRLYPTPSLERPLPGTYLAHDVRNSAAPDRAFVYANFVTSLDGRTSQIDREIGRIRPPRAISNRGDWRLYKELAAQADAVVTSGSRLNAMLQEDRDDIQCVEEIEEGDIAAWRRARGLAAKPACIVLSKEIDFSVEALLAKPRCDFIIVVGSRADAEAVQRLRSGGVEVRVAKQRWIIGQDLDVLAHERGFRTMYLIGGPDILYTMLDAGRLDRLYLTKAHVALGGRDYDTLVRGDALAPPAGFRLHELYLSPAEHDKPEILFASYNFAPP